MLLAAVLVVESTLAAESVVVVIVSAAGEAAVPRPAAPAVAAAASATVPGATEVDEHHVQQLLRDSVFEDLEVLGSQIGDRAALVISDDDVHTYP